MLNNGVCINGQTGTESLKQALIIYNVVEITALKS